MARWSSASLPAVVSAGEGCWREPGADRAQMLNGFDKIRSLASGVELTVPAHDPLVRRLFPDVAPDVFRLDAEPLGRIDSRGRLA